MNCLARRARWGAALASLLATEACGSRRTADASVDIGPRVDGPSLDTPAPLDTPTPPVDHFIALDASAIIDEGAPPVLYPGCPSDVTTPDASDSSTDAALPGMSCETALDLNALGVRTGNTLTYVGTTCGTPEQPPLALLSDCTVSVHAMMFTYTLQSDASIHVTLRTRGTPVNFDTILDMRAPCSDVYTFPSEYVTIPYTVCDDDDVSESAQEVRSSLDLLEMAAGTTVHLTVSGARSPSPLNVNAGPFEMDVVETPRGAHGYVASRRTGSAAAPFVDACTAGTAVSWVAVDPPAESTHAIAPIPLPFAFPYYGTLYSEGTPDTNGYMTFGAAVPSDDSPIAQPSRIPTFLRGEGPLVAPYLLWTSVNPLPPDTMRSVCSLTTGAAPHRAFVVEWRDASTVPEVLLYLHATYEVVLHEEGPIDFVYQTMIFDSANAGFAFDLSSYLNGLRATIGIQNDGASDYTLSGGQFPPFPFSIHFEPP